MFLHGGFPSSLRLFAHLETITYISHTLYTKKPSNSLSGGVQECLSLLDFLCMVNVMGLVHICW